MERSGWSTLAVIYKVLWFFEIPGVLNVVSLIHGSHPDPPLKVSDDFRDVISSPNVKQSRFLIPQN